MKTPTPHNSANFGDFAKTCIICGDPLRAKYIAEKFLNDAKLVNNIRGIQGYTGFFKGKKISVMGHGMGMPSLVIYVHELYNFYGVENILRIGTAGSVSDDTNLSDVIVATSATTPSNITKNFGYKLSTVFNATNFMAEKIFKKANELKIKTVKGKIVSADLFYDSKKNLLSFAKNGALAVDMEIAGLYMLAEKFNKNAVAILNVTDKPLQNIGLGAEERVTLMDKLITLGLESAIDF